MDLEELNSTITGFQDTIKDLEEELANTTGRAEMTEMRVDLVESGIASLNTTKASIEAVNELSDRVAQLDTEKADRTEVEILSANLTSLEATIITHERVSELESELRDVRVDVNVTAGMLDDARADIAKLERQLNTTTSTLQISHQELSAGLGLTGQELNSTASALQGTVQDLEDWLTNITERTETLETRGNRIESDIASLNSTKASRDTVNDQVTKLEREKVDLTEFEMLSDNVTTLAEVSSRVDEEIRQELDELADSALNQNHELHQAIASKASQTDLEALASSTVRTQTFLQRVESIQNSILQLQWNITLNFTHFDGRIQTLNMTLSTKADQQDVTALSNRVMMTVDMATFQELNSTVLSIQENKANNTDLKQLQTRVMDLEDNTATKSNLSKLENELSDHSSTSDKTHRVLSSDIRSNNDSISDNTDRITELESTTPGLTPSQLVIAVSVSLTMVTILWAA